MARYQWYLPNNKYKIELSKLHSWADLKLLKLSQTPPVRRKPDIKFHPTHSGLTAQRHHKFIICEGWSCLRMDQQLIPWVQPLESRHDNPKSPRLLATQHQPFPFLSVLLQHFKTKLQ